MTMYDPNPSRAKRRWYQFSLRTLIASVLIGGAVFGLIAARMNRAAENRERVAAVEKAMEKLDKLGGYVESKYEKLRSQTWLEELFDDPGGVDDPVGVLNVSTVYLSGTKLTDVGLEHLKGLPIIQYLSLNYTHLTDLDVEHLQGLTNVKHLDLGLITVNKEDIRKLQQALPNCKITTFNHW